MNRLTIAFALGLAGLSAGSAEAQSQLPYPEYRYKGNVGTTFKDSDPAAFPKAVTPPEGAPNVLLILLDDVGFGQLSVTGGLVPTPNLEKIAKKGVLYNRFHTTALCSPSRAALLTGRNHHSVGTGVITEMATGYDGYTGIIPKSTATIGEVLRQNGYATAWFGKNHNTPVYEAGPLGPFDRWPNGLGFDYFYGFNAGDTNQFKPNLVENRNHIGTPDDPDFHLTTALADRTIEYLQRAEAVEPEKPWFVYLAPAATHAPHHAPKEWLNRFKGQFDMGWDAYRELVFERQKKMGIIPADTRLTPRHDGLAAWSSLNDDQKKLFSRMMEIFAAYGAHADFEMGRVLDCVNSLPDADNTLIIYILGDNGSSPEGGLEGAINQYSFFNGYTFTYEETLPHIDELGTAKHFNHFPAAWAWAMCTPFQWTKQVASHLGGVRNPMIISWPARMNGGNAIRTQFTHLVDIAPTILEAVGLPAPDMVNGVAQKPMEGVSFLASVFDADAEESRRSQYFELVANRAIYEDGWWAASVAFAPWATERSGYDPFEVEWELYNLEEDFSQAVNLAKDRPKKLEEMKTLWWTTASRYDVMPLDWRAGERFSGALTGKPNPAAGRQSILYASPVVAVPELVSPDLKNKSFSITAEIEVDDNASGMIFTQGGNTGGWGFYLLDGKLYFTHNYIDLNRYTVMSRTGVPAGKHTVKAEFIYDGGKAMGKGGAMKIYLGDKVVAQGKAEQTTPIKYAADETQDIGNDLGSPVDDNYDSPFPFEGSLKNILVELKP
jgi:arylsulfatase A-like enzyme